MFFGKFILHRDIFTLTLPLPSLTETTRCCCCFFFHFFLLLLQLITNYNSINVCCCFFLTNFMRSSRDVFCVCERWGVSLSISISQRDLIYIFSSSNKIENEVFLIMFVVIDTHTRIPGHARNNPFSVRVCYFILFLLVCV